MTTPGYATLRLILGDQLNIKHPWFLEKDLNVMYVLMEVRQETDYATHHIQKIIAFFTAMRAFADSLQSMGLAVHYFALDDPANTHSITQNIALLIQQYKCQKFEYQLPDEMRLDEELKTFCASLSIPTSYIDTFHFYTQRDDLSIFFSGKKGYLMENFYRHMRKKHGILMENSQPVGSAWNYDKENRKALPKNHSVPAPKLFSKDVTLVADMVKKHGVYWFGKVDTSHFHWPTTRQESVELMNYFAENLLPFFGTYQDALSRTEWALYHSRLSFSLNSKLLSPMEVVDTAVMYWQQNPDSISLPQIEGFVRQIVGWREYMRGIYWAEMPDFGDVNYFQHTASLPNWYWTGKTKMTCMRSTIGQSLEHAYAHHIQRLMITGNFALLIGAHPSEVDKWYLGIYIDAIEWVEITNTRGMSQFADGGLVGTKPYVASANYIHKMGDYCKSCYYDHTKKYGVRACPFNSLYWNFYDRHRDRLSKNARIGMAYLIWDKMPVDEKTKILEQATQYLSHIETL